MEKELVLFVGVQFVGKTEYLKENYFGKEYQIISYDAIQNALMANGVDPNKNLYPIVGIIAKNYLLQELPVVVNGLNISIESLHIWKKLCFEHQYIFKLIIFDVSLENIIENMKKRQLLTEENEKIIKTNYEMFQELKIILDMKHQKIADDILFIKSEEEKDEILQD
jgi:predicted kinase